MKNKIESFRDEYFFLSNFYNSKINVFGLTFENGEAAFQSQKTLDKDIQKKFCSLNPTESKKMGRMVNLRKDWESIKMDVMEEVIRAKFSQNEELKNKLLQTGDRYLEEGNTWGDKIWGTVNGSGANLLGQILMKIREEFKELEKNDLDFEI